MPESAETRRLRQERLLREAHERQIAADERARKGKSFLKNLGISALAAGIAAASWFGVKSLQKTMEDNETKEARVTLTSKPQMPRENKKLKKVIVEETVIEDEDSNYQQQGYVEEVPQQQVIYTQPAQQTYVEGVIQQPVTEDYVEQPEEVIHVQTAPRQTVVVHDNEPSVIDRVIGTALDMALTPPPPRFHGDHPPVVHGGHHEPMGMMPSPRRGCGRMETPHHEMRPTSRGCAPMAKPMHHGETRMGTPHRQGGHSEVRGGSHCGGRMEIRGGQRCEGRSMGGKSHGGQTRVMQSLGHASRQGGMKAQPTRQNHFNQALRSGSHQGGMRMQGGSSRSHGSRSSAPRSGSRGHSGGGHRGGGHKGR